MKTQNTKTLSIIAKDLALRIVFPLRPALACLFGRFSVVCATSMILGLLLCGLSAYSQAVGLRGQAQFEPASVVGLATALSEQGKTQMIADDRR